MSDANNSGFNLPIALSPNIQELQELSELLEDFTPSDFGMLGDSCATRMTYYFRRIWLVKRRSQHPAEVQLDARSLAIRIKTMGWLELFFSMILWLFSVGPNILNWLLEKSRSKNIWVSTIITCLFFGIGIILQFYNLHILAVLPYLLGVLMLSIQVLRSRFLRSELWDKKVESWIAKINSSNARIKGVYQKATGKLDDLLERTKDHMDQTDLLGFEDEAIKDIEETMERLRILKERYRNNRWALRYLQQGVTLIKTYSHEKAEALWKWEQSRVNIDENAKAHRWSATVLATLIGGFTLAIRITIVLAIVLSPIIYFAISNHPTSAEVNVIGETQKTEFQWKLLESLGLIVALIAIAKLTATWLINFITRVAMRQLQFKKVFKKAAQDQLDSDCMWQLTKIHLSELLEAHLETIAATIDNKGLNIFQKRQHEQQRRSMREELERLKLQYFKLTGKPWIEPKQSSSDTAGAIFDSGAPGEIADGTAQGFLDSLLELV